MKNKGRTKRIRKGETVGGRDGDEGTLKEVKVNNLLVGAVGIAIPCPSRIPFGED